MVNEEEVGITQYANSLPGFTGILKHRYTDFKVNEVDPQGGVVRLTSLDLPQPQAGTQVRPPQQGAAAGDVAAPAPAPDVEAALTSFAQLAGEAQLPQVRLFLEQALAWQAAPKGKAAGEGGERASRPKPPAPLTLDPIADKETRKAVHQLFKSLPGFPPLETTTVAQPAAATAAPQQQQQGQPSSQQQQQQQQQQEHGEGEEGVAQQPAEKQVQAARAAASSPPAALQCIQIRTARGGKGGGGGRGQKRTWRQAHEWAGGDKDFTRFVLYKENLDSQVSISTLARLLHVNHKLFGVAGTKDKRGVTVQAVSAYRLDPARLAGLNPRLRGMRVGNFSFADRGLWLGDLRGNRFEVILRNIEVGSPAAVEAAAAGLRQSGFVNYFGLQRFGSGAVPTHRVGQALLRGQWQEAVRLLMTPREDGKPEVVTACQAYLEEGDIAAAQRQMPRHLVAENAILQGLKQYGPTQFLQSLQLIPRNLRTMYLHAYQSYLWNAAASHRVSTFPHDRPVAGDLVLIPAADGASGSAAAAGVAVADSAAAAAAAAEALEDNRDGEGELGDEAGPAAGEAAGELEEGSVHVVTEEEAAAGRYRMDDVVLPLPGYRIQYPQHSTAQVYTEVAQRDGVSLTEAPHGTKEFMLTQLTGSYRRVIHRPTDLTYELLQYSDPNQELATTDLMELEGRGPAPPAQQAQQAQQEGQQEGGAEGAGTEGEGEGGGQEGYLALRLAFQLPTSCYATMLIRELTKMPTHTGFHKALQH